jgi:branched-chain amino acid transport system ATP-binding protein
MLDKVNSPLLSTIDLKCGYGKIEVINEVNVVINTGEIISIIGANGAGKTTLLKAISGLIPVQDGIIALHTKNSDLKGNSLNTNENISKLKTYKRVSLGLSLVPEGRQIFSRLTVKENLELGAYLRSDKVEIKVDLEKVYSLFRILKERSNQLGGTLSGGEQQMLAIGRALMSKPKLLLLDEPSMGVAPLLVSRIFETILQLNQEGLTILLVEQNAKLALKISTRSYILETGRITLEGNSKELLNDDRVIQAYLS